MKKRIALFLSICLAAAQLPCYVSAGEVSGNTTERSTYYETDYVSGDDTEDEETDLLLSGGESEEADLLLSGGEVEETKDVADASALEDALASGVKSIRITGDFSIDRTFYVDHETEIFADEPHTLTRDPGFGGEMFVVGEDSSGRNTVLDNKKAVLSLGSSDASDTGLLTIDGNRDSMRTAVTGSVLFICYSGTVNIYKDVIIQNCLKDSNEKTAVEKYNLPYPERIGGAVAIIANGILNVYGGSFKGNSVNNESGDNSEERISSVGAVIFNFSCLNIYDGEFTNNSAARGGVIYNYRMASVEKGLFKNNTAEKYGGAIYQAASQFGQIMLGNENGSSEDKLTFESNHADASGGVIFSQTKNAVVINGNTVFKGNSAKNNGGAINISGTLTIHEAEFDSNTADSKGGAIYIVNSDPELTTRIVRISNTMFDSNRAERGGALGIMADEEGYSEGGRAVLKNCTFENNKAEPASGVVEEGKDYHGGAIYLIRKSSLDVEDSDFNDNTAKQEGGALYCSSESNVVITRSEFDSNKVSENGGSISVHSAVLNITDSSFSNDSCEKNGGSLYISYVGDSSKDSEVKVVNTDFSQNTSYNHGGAIYVTSHIDGSEPLILKNSSLTENYADTNGGALYVTGSKVYAYGTEFRENEAHSTKYGGGGAYLTGGILEADNCGFIENESVTNAGAVALYASSVLTLNESIVDGNSSEKKGGAFYNSGSELYLFKVSVSNNEAIDTGGAISLHSSGTAIICDSCFSDNTSDKNGGAVFAKGSELKIYNSPFENNTTSGSGGSIYLDKSADGYVYTSGFSGNEADNKGGAFYLKSAGLKVYKGSFSGNSSGSGGGIYFDKSSGAYVYDSDFSDNESEGNGGAVYSYQEAEKVIFRECNFSKNKANATNGLGGAIYCSGKDTGSLLTVFHSTAFFNSASSGGFLYETKTGTVVSLDGIRVSGNAASSAAKGPLIYGYNATLNINKNTWTDDENDTLDETYWSNAIKNEVKVNNVATDAPEIPVFEDYDGSYTPRKDEENIPVEKDAILVRPIFDLENSGSGGHINNAFDELPVLDNSSNFMSSGTKVFSNINGQDVAVDTFVEHSSEAAHNPSFGEGMLIYQAMLYKKAHPAEDVSIEFSTFRFCTETALCINRKSRYFGYMRNVTGEEFDDNGFVRISYLLTAAASMGIKVTLIGQMEGYPYSDDSTLRFIPYYEDKLDRPCDPSYAAGKHISDYLDFQFVYWTSYGEDAASDMMHTKVCAVSDYLDMNGTEHHNSIWASCTNLDGIDDSGTNGSPGKANNGMQTGLIISDHEGLYRAASNYLRLVSGYCGQEDIYDFRVLANKMATEQTDLILEGREEDIPVNERIVYLGRGNDDIFELYFAPFGGGTGIWDEKYNPFCKYLGELSRSDDYIWFIWNNPKFTTNFSLCNTATDIIKEAFHRIKSTDNRFYVVLPDYPAADFDDLSVGADIGLKSINKKEQGKVHSKDLQFSYSDKDKRHYVTLLNSINFHQGGMSYQSNQALVINETSYTEDSVFYTLADLTAKGVADANDFKEFNVCFEENGGSVIDDVIVGWKHRINKPEDPERDGFKFIGWFKDASLTSLWDFDNDTVTENITLYAGWEESGTESGKTGEKHTVKFDPCNGEKSWQSEVIHGEKLAEPEKPVWNGYDFKGWFRETESITKWDFLSDTVSADMVLYGGWKKISSNDTSGEGSASDNEAGKDDPGKGDPGKGDPGKGDPGKGDPGKDDSGKDSPSNNESGGDEPGGDDLGKEDSGNNSQDPGSAQMIPVLSKELTYNDHIMTFNWSSAVIFNGKKIKPKHLKLLFRIDGVDSDCLKMKIYNANKVGHAGDRKAPYFKLSLNKKYSGPFRKEINRELKKEKFYFNIEPLDLSTVSLSAKRAAFVNGKIVIKKLGFQGDEGRIVLKRSKDSSHRKGDYYTEDAPDDNGGNPAVWICGIGNYTGRFLLRLS